MEIRPKQNNRQELRRKGIRIVSSESSLSVCLYYNSPSKASLYKCTGDTRNYLQKLKNKTNPTIHDIMNIYILKGKLLLNKNGMLCWTRNKVVTLYWITLSHIFSNKTQQQIQTMKNNIIFSDVRSVQLDIKCDIHCRRISI